MSVLAPSRNFRDAAPKRLLIAAERAGFQSEVSVFVPEPHELANGRASRSRLIGRHIHVLSSRTCARLLRIPRFARRGDLNNTLRFPAVHSLAIT
jgi:hypothetical protein